MYRKDGPIPTIYREKYPRKLLVFDTEAYRGEIIEGVETQTFRMAVCWYIELDDNLNIVTDQFHYFTNISALLGAIETHAIKDQTLYIYAHNLKYDLQLSGLLTELIQNKWEVRTFVMDDPPTFIRLKRNRHSIMMVDTFNYWQTSLAKMGDQLDFPKLIMPDESKDNEAWFVYCKRDVEVLGHYLLSFMRWLKENNLCGLGLTLASQSFRTFRHRFMTHPIILHSRPEVLTLERQAYSGGRVEAYFIGSYPQQDYYKLDVNSMYPYVMKNNLYPREFIAYAESDDVDLLALNMTRYYVIAQVRIQTDNAAFPYKNLHKLVFPVGDYVTTLHHSELEYALQTGCIREVHKAAVYSQADIFTPYIDFFYQVKLQAEKDHNPVIRHQSKILMNSLYGKFGQRNTVSSIGENTTNTPYGRITGYSETLNTTIEINCLGDQMEVSYKQGESTYSSPVIAGAVTAYARMYLWKLITTAGVKHVYYCDTDSLIVDKVGFRALSPLLHETALGMLKLEDTTDKITVYGAKDYTVGTDIKHKGVPKNAIELSPGRWEYDQFLGAKSWIKTGLQPGVKVFRTVKSRKSEYDKGLIQPDGSVLPLLFSWDGEG